MEFVDVTAAYAGFFVCLGSFISNMAYVIAAGIFGVKVKKFNLFFDGSSMTKFIANDTEYSLGWMPLGGYVTLAGWLPASQEDEKEALIPESQKLRSKPPYARFLCRSIPFFVLPFFIVFFLALSFDGSLSENLTMFRECLMNIMNYTIGKKNEAAFSQEWLAFSPHANVFYLCGLTVFSYFFVGNIFFKFSSEGRFITILYLIIALVMAYFLFFNLIFAYNTVFGGIIILMSFFLAEHFTGLILFLFLYLFNRSKIQEEKAV
ncbi:MAG: site-2 protease family protein [Cytophagaceae bacterium]